jgi:hypothetical protein
MAPALDAPVVDHELATGLPAARAHAPAAAQPDAHDHPLTAETDIDDWSSAQTEQPAESRGDAHVALLEGR